MEAEEAMKECRRVKRELESQIDALKIAHRQELKAQQQRYSKDIHNKNEKLKKMWDEVIGHSKMFGQLLDEMKDDKKCKTRAQKDVKILKDRADAAGKRVQKLTELCRELKDEIRDEQETVNELQDKVQQYEQIIDFMKHEYENKETEHQNIIDFMDHYYEEEVERLSPRYIKKHWVKNATRGKSFHYCCIAII